MQVKVALPPRTSIFLLEGYTVTAGQECHIIASSTGTLLYVGPVFFIYLEQLLLLKMLTGSIAISSLPLCHTATCIVIIMLAFNLIRHT